MTVETEVDGRIGRLTLNRPEAMNAITTELAAALDAALVALEPQVDVIVIRGAGAHFCVGGDFKALEALREEGPAAMAELFETFGRACARIGTLEVPVVCAVHGYAMAGGFELMQACDIAIVAEDCRLADNHANFGQVPGGGGSQRLPRLVGRQRASAHILTGGRLSGADAVAWGLAAAAVPAGELAEAADALATLLAGKARAAQAKVKRLIRDGLELSLADGLALERRVVVEHLTGAEAGAGIASFTTRGA
ncbi:enoyl-CoA hydratase/isomerase family protein [Paraconexibacter antarcticus]|uniref:Enoyl-CoA hydratase/isomerase family protein n=1 Tax=Paraconexibacter antarcticus TaxID=2949664 RepID=A0ABY5DS34_9ACTN|nr:enoyl-CoA hydratase/isomerase family protein [Paraconexibacter antarcticus]UTI63510.1 enoyl-CoA hydratase/isomerase family protein [Paraconexibacter antarcticus]